MTYESQHINVSINCTPDQVYEFASNPENLLKWASGLSKSIEYVNGEWVAELTFPLKTVPLETSQFR